MELYYVISIVDRSQADAMLSIMQELKLSIVLANIARGTATEEHLLLYDLQQTEKAIVTTVASGEVLEKLTKYAKLKLMIDIPGNGILMAFPIKSVSGGRALTYITEGQNLGGATMPSMNFENEMIIVILNEGYSDAVMDAARTGGASGGTVIHAKGTGRGEIEKFHGVSLADEKDMIYILASSDKKSDIMKAINQQCGMGTDAGAISFSLPVSEVVGLRNFDAKALD